MAIGGDQKNITDDGKDTTVEPSDEQITGEDPDFAGHQFGGHQFGRFGGWLPDTPDNRDEPLIPDEDPDLPEADPADAPPAIFRLVPEPAGDGRYEIPWQVPVYDQRPATSPDPTKVADGKAPYLSCVSCSIASVIEYLEEREGKAPGLSDPARLFLYYNARVLEGTQGNAEVGVGIRTALKALRRFGACADELWPYAARPVVEPPSADCYTSALYDGSIRYKRIFRRVKTVDTAAGAARTVAEAETADLDLTPIRRALRNDLPVICGFTVYPSFRGAQETGVAHLPLTEEERAPEPDRSGKAGPDANVRFRATTFGHASVIIGYDTEADTFTLVNSWGPGFGRGGRFTLPAAYLADPRLASDFWVITTLGEPGDDSSMATAD